MLQFTLYNIICVIKAGEESSKSTENKKKSAIVDKSLYFAKNKFFVCVFAIRFLFL